ncbi:MAG: hypothetical protein K9M99_04565 [Candidatus Cloacimonetes bacterium]|nr:hypothetical protein [Candidatus Cloacimonadota bacterium]
MKFICIFTCLVLAASSLLAISDSQNKQNIIYLDNLDLSLIESIDLIVAFNKSATNMKGAVQGAEQFSKFLLDLTLELSSLRKTITESLEMDNDQRENTILAMMAELKPQTIEIQYNIDREQDISNSRYLEQRLIKLQNQLNSYRAEIIKTENSISQSKSIPNDFLNLHNRHFIYNLLLCFAQDYQLLSDTNKQFLTDLIQKIDLNIYKQKL